MNWRTWVPLVVAIVLGLVAAQLGRTLLRRGAPAQNKLVQVVTVTQALPAKSCGGLQALVPEGMRAITIEVNEFSGLAGLLAPGAHVDLIATLQGGGAGELITRTIVQNVRVTAVGQRLNAGKTEEEAGPVSHSVTLLVTPQQAEAIELAYATGRPRLVLRGNGDTLAAQTPGATLSGLRGQEHPAATEVARAALPATQPAVASTDQRTVQVLRGGVESHVVFQVPKPEPRMITGASLEPVVPPMQDEH